MSEHDVGADGKPNDGSDVLALVRQVGLAGFVRDEKITAPIIAHSELRGLFRRNVFREEAAHADWRPTPDAWMPLAIALAVEHRDKSVASKLAKNPPATPDGWMRFVIELAIKHREAGFTLKPVEVSGNAKTAYREMRIAMMNHYYLKRQGDGELMRPCKENRQEGITGEIAAKEVMREIHRRVKDKDDEWFGLKGLANVSWKSLETAYSTYLNSSEPKHRIGYTISLHSQRTRERREFLDACRAFTLWDPI